MAKFKTRARAVDMLGRQQIAGIPSAISELFKNAHDAYADRVEIDYYRWVKLFVLRDDGLGMTRQDFETRWLTLGTESKMDAKAGLKLPPIDPTKPRRPILGEKGIGRLAIASIGPQVLVLSRARRDDKVHDLVAAYINWGIFEQPGLNLEDIEIPVRSFPSGQLPTAKDLADMVKDFERNLISLPKDIVANFHRDFKTMKLDPSDIDKYVDEMSLSGEGCGTHFIIAPAYDVLISDIEGGDDYVASSFDKTLLGFTNQVTPNRRAIGMKISFRDHLSPDVVEDWTERDRFITAEEFTSADHHIEGTVDEFGQFRGKVKVYDNAPIVHTIPWGQGNGKKTDCGPFTISVAYVQGKQTETLLLKHVHSDIVKKLNKFGGIYIYKEGVRIQPYGQVDFDWLGIEQRRTLSASDHFFSYRRMFGAIDISQIGNSNLVEKAGREGFRENNAYKQFKDILKNVFIQLANSFFREGGAFDTLWDERRKMLDQMDKVRRNREKTVSGKKKLFSNELDTFFNAIKANDPLIRAQELEKSIYLKLEDAKSINDSKQAALVILDIEESARRRLRKLEDEYRIAKPKGIGLSRSLEQRFFDYGSIYQRLQTEVFGTVRKAIDDDVTQVANIARLELDRRIRIERALKQLADQAQKAAKQERAETNEVIGKVQNEVQQAVQSSIVAINEEVREVLADFGAADFSEMPEEQVVTIRDQLELRLIKVKEDKQDFLRSIRNQLESIDLENPTEHFDEMEAVERRMIALEERSDLDLQLTQLGMAIEVINHEFDSSIRGIRSHLRVLRGWADVNEGQGLEKVYEGLRANFDHLDGYLTLFTPLHRRLYREQVLINGWEITDYVKNIFKQRFERHHIEVVSTPSFTRYKILNYPSTFYPVFVNLVDNAIFWLKDYRDIKHPENEQPEHIIKLDASGDKLFISNNGPEILSTRREVIFESGITFKPAGRGLGLAISREILRKEGYDLILTDEARNGMNVTFCIYPKKTN